MNFVGLRETQRMAFYSGLPEDELPYCTVLSKEMITQQMKEYSIAASARVLTREELQEASTACVYLWHISDGVESYQKVPALKIFTEAIRAHMARRLGLLPNVSHEEILQKIWSGGYFVGAENDDPELVALANAEWFILRNPEYSARARRGSGFTTHTLTQETMADCSTSQPNRK